MIVTWALFIILYGVQSTIIRAFVFGPVPLMDKEFSRTRTHLRQTYSAVCMLMYEWLKDNKYVGSEDLMPPKTDGLLIPVDSCPILEWLDVAFLKQASNRARQESLDVLSNIPEQAKQVDLDSNTQKDAKYHFDAEHFVEGNQLLMNTRASIIRDLKKVENGSASNLRQIRQSLGYLLHTLQDFYAHSNWVEMNKDGIAESLGVKAKLDMPIAGEKQRTCKTCKRNLSAENNTELNKVKINAADFFTTLYSNDYVYVCHDNILVTNVLTSGYTSSFPKDPSLGKCSHGGGMDSTSADEATGGINKDTDYFPFAPHFYLHEAAANYSYKATLKFLRDLRKDVADSAFGELLGIIQRPQLVILMDVSNSMSNALAAAKDLARQLVTQVNVTSKQVTYVFMPFNKTAYGQYKETGEIKLILDWINEVVADKSGNESSVDCFPALHEATLKSRYGTNFFVFTNSPSNRVELAPVIRSRGQDSAFNVNFVVLGTHMPKRRKLRRHSGRSKRDYGSFYWYEYIAAGTGGIVLWGYDASLNVSSLVGDLSTMDVGPGVQVQLLRHRNIHCGTPVAFPITSRISRLELVISSEGVINTSEFKLYKPDGIQLLPLSVITITSHVSVFRTDNPAEGVWNLLYNCSSKLPVDVTVKGVSDLTIDYAFMTTPSESDRGELVKYIGLVNMQGNPLAGHQVFLQLSCRNCNNMTAQFVDCNNNNKVINEYPCDIPLELNTCCANVTIPNEVTCLRVKGVSNDGSPFVRESGLEISPAKVALSFHQIVDVNAAYTITPNNNLTVYFQLKNYGNKDSFQILVDDSLQFVRDWSPKILTVEAGGVGNGTVRLNLTGDVVYDDGAASDMRVSAVSLHNPENNNYRIVRITVSNGSDYLKSTLTSNLYI